MLRDHGLQFVLRDYRTPAPPRWLDWLGDFLNAAMPGLNFFFWVGVAALVALIVFFLGRELLGLRMRRRKPERTEPQSAWRFDEVKARILLAEADRLAAEGQYAQAAHLLLLKGVEDVQERRPRDIRPALTSREIAGLPQLPAQARSAFSVIAEVVERSLFGGREVDEGGWTECRRSYEALVVAEAWR